MLILHISDIHFKAPQCASEDDPNRPYRTRMVQDVKARCAQLGRIDALLIGGDIAYRADPIEYEAASKWLTELAQECGCPLERIFVVPGNHDVDRGIVKRKLNIQNAHAAIAFATAGQRAGVLQAQMADDSVGHALFEPLAAYNEFAKKFDCQVYPKRLLWKQDLPLRSDVTLRLHGLTSTLLSGAVNAHGQDDTRDSLYLSPWQTVFDPVENVVNAVISHHPPDWFMDHESVEAAVRGRAKLQFFGHRHNQGNISDRQYMRFEAGALNPDLNELAWHPAFNIIKLTVEGDGADRKLHIAAQFMTWQAGQPERYVRLIDPDGSEIWHHAIAIPGQANVIAPINTNSNTPTTVVEATLEEPIEPQEEVIMVEQSRRRIVTRWWRLPMDARRAIALQLGLISEAEIQLPEPERYGLALARAGERNLTEQLAREIEKWEIQ